MSWVVETNGEATCMKDYISMHAPVVELLSAEDVALAVQYLNPTLSKADTRSLYKKGRLVDMVCNLGRFRGKPYHSCGS